MRKISIGVELMADASRFVIDLIRAGELKEEHMIMLVLHFYMELMKGKENGRSQRVRT